MPLTAEEELELIELLEEEERCKARKNHIEFIKYCWMKKSEEFIKGFHTEIICNRIDKAFEDFRNGKSTYLRVAVHHRSGKSDLLSRYLPPHFLGEFPSCEVLSTTFKADLTQKFTADARNIFRSEKYNELYPGLGLSKESNAKAYWEIVDKETKEQLFGKLFGSGLSSGITGSGGHLVLVDDPLSGRADAESKKIRDKVWDALTNDLMTRLAPVHIVIFLCTTWHWDDPHGRVINEMEKSPLFPQFESLCFPAKAKDYKGPGKYPGEYLFLERYPKKWYEAQYAILGKYAAAALLDCSPMLKTGGILSLDGIVYHDLDDKTIPGTTDIQWAQIWDLAHTKKQREGDDPDWTSGTWLGFQRLAGDPVLHLWIKRRVKCQEGAAKRDKFIRMYTDSVDKFCKHAIETSIDSKDAYNYAVNNMPEYSWQDIQCRGDKVVRASPLEPIFEAPGHVHVIKGSWNDDWIDELIKFDGTGAAHDDGIDNLTAGYIFLVGEGTSYMPDDLLDKLASRKR